MDTVQWWLASTTFGFSGEPMGPPEWPIPGGRLRQPGKLVEAVDLLRSEWNHLPRAEERKKQPAVAPTKVRRRR